MRTQSGTLVKVADEVWIAAALLQRDNPEAADFAIDEIVNRVADEAIMGKVRPGVYVHIVQHCVANRPPNPGRYRMLFETRPGRRRLYRPGDHYDSARSNSKTLPEPDEIPAAYFNLLSWYREWSKSTAKSAVQNDPLLALAGSGKKLWADEPPDDYVRRLRKGWE